MAAVSLPASCALLYPNASTDNTGSIEHMFTDPGALTGCPAGLSHAGAAAAAGRLHSHFLPCLLRCGQPPLCCPLLLWLVLALDLPAAPPAIIAQTMQGVSSAIRITDALCQAAYASITNRLLRSECCKCCSCKSASWSKRLCAAFAHTRMDVSRGMLARTSQR